MYSKTDDMSRIVVVGTSCAGKTTLAKKIACALDLPHVEMDAIYWRPDWEPSPTEEFCASMSEALVGDRWITDGNYSIARDIVWRRATALIWLNYPFPLVFGRALSRTVRRSISGEELFSGNRETLRGNFLSADSMLLWVLKTHWKRQKEYPRLFREDEFSHLRIIELNGPRATDAFVAEYEDSARTAQEG
jgi:adenylate kinase family enzyme